MTNAEYEDLRQALLSLDDPFFLNTFSNAQDEDEWWRLNEAYAHKALDKVLPSGMTTANPEVWRAIRKLLQQFEQ